MIVAYFISRTISFTGRKLDVQKGDLYDIGKLNDNRAYFRHFLCAVPASNASFKFFLAFLHSKSFKFESCLGGFLL